MATVDLAEDTLLGRLVALKRMSGPADAQGLSRLRREALAGASVSHANVVSIYDAVTAEDDHLIIVMEYVKGETLRQALQREGALPAAEALRILDKVAAGLDAIHRQGIVHRDVKPSNILLGADGTVKVADLGIASVPDGTRITTSGAVLGSLSYMAPEQLGDDPSTHAVDVYALAAVAFEVLSGQKARRAANPVALAHAIATQPPPSLREAWPAAPSPAVELLLRGMARDPQERPTSAGELIRRLRAGLEPETTAQMARTRSMALPVAAPLRRPVTPSPPQAGSSSRGDPEGDETVPPPPAHTGARSRARLLAAGLVGLVGVAVVVAVLSNSGSAGPPGADSSASSGHSRTASHSGTAAKSGGSSATGSSTASASGSTSAVAGTAAPAAGSTAAGTPVAAVKSFYGLAAAHRYARAWTLADPTLQQELGGYQSFQAGQAQDQSITFNSARTVDRSSTSATVAVRTTSVQTNGTHNCGGTVNLAAGGSSGPWRLHLIHINCS